MFNTEKTIRALVDTIISQYRIPGCNADQTASVGAYVMAAQSRMPDYLRLPFGVLIMVFAVWPYPAKGKPFHKLEPSERGAQIRSWENSRFEFRRGLVAFYRTLSTFGIYSEIYKGDNEAGGLHE